MTKINLFNGLLQLTFSLILTTYIINQANASCYPKTPKPSEPECAYGQTQSDINSLLIEASAPQYTVRRIEITGNTFTSDKTLFRRIILQEGDVFTVAKLNSSIYNLSRMKSLKFARLSEVRLDRKNKIIDLLFTVQEKSRL